jgi:hypothetical protein
MRFGSLSTATLAARATKAQQKFEKEKKNVLYHISQHLQ